MHRCSVSGRLVAAVLFWAARKHQSFYFRIPLQGTPLTPITLRTWTVMAAACFILGILPASVVPVPQ